jgi:hypothetical protein
MTMRNGTPTGGAPDFERELEEALRSEADAVQPSGDGLSVIRRKIDRRRARRLWLVPLSGIAGAAAVGTLAFAVFGSSSDRLDQDNHAATQSSTGAPSVSPTAPQPTAPATTPVTGVGKGTYAIWPFATADDAGAWDKSDPATAWQSSEKLVAQKYVTTFGGDTVSSITAEQPFVDSAGDTEVPVSRKVDNGPTIELGVVHLHRWDNGSWSVTQVTAANRGFLNLQPGAPVASPQVVTGIHHPEDGYVVSVYPVRGGKPIGTARSAATSGTEWSATLTFDATGTTLGSVVATDPSLADGGLGAIIAVPVLFTGSAVPPPPSSPATPTTTPSPDLQLPGSMTTYVGVQDGRIALYGTVSGRLVRYLTDRQPGGGDSAPSVSTDRKWVYFLRGTGTCANEIARVPLSNGAESGVETVKAPASGFVVESVSAGAGDAVTWIERSCAGDGRAALAWKNAAGGAAGRLTVDMAPPTWIGTPRLSPDGTKVAALLKTGNQQHIAVYDVRTAKTIDDVVSTGCPAETCTGIDFDWAPDGSFVILSDPTTIVRVVSGAKTATTLLAAKADIGTRIDVSQDGSGVLVWSGPNGGQPALSDTIGYYRVTTAAAQFVVSHAATAAGSW